MKKGKQNKFIKLFFALALVFLVILSGCGGGGDPTVTQYTLEIGNVIGQGQVNPAPGNYTRDENASVDLTVTPANDWQFKEWVGNNGNDVIEETTDDVEVNDEVEVEDVDKIDIDFSEKISFEDDLVIISGTTNFEDGTILNYEIENLDNIDDYIEGTIEVVNSEFKEEIDISNFSDGEILAWLGFSPYNQNEEIQEVYGEEGEHLASEISVQKKFIKETPVELSGQGDTATEDFFLRSGLAVLDFEHAGSRNIIVELLDESGNRVELMINEIGSYQGKTLADIPRSGEYILNIQADGSWNAEISQAMPSEIPKAPETFTGTGDDVFFVELEAGRSHFEFEHDGQSNFIVQAEGQVLLVNEIGAYEGSTAQNVQDSGPYIISVNADGNWSVSIE